MDEVKGIAEVALMAIIIIFGCFCMVKFSGNLRDQLTDKVNEIRVAVGEEPLVTETENIDSVYTDDGDVFDSINVNADSVSIDNNYGTVNIYVTE